MALSPSPGVSARDTLSPRMIPRPFKPRTTDSTGCDTADVSDPIAALLFLRGGGRESFLRRLPWSVSIFIYPCYVGICPRRLGARKVRVSRYFCWGVGLQLGLFGDWVLGGLRCFVVWLCTLYYVSIEYGVVRELFLYVVWLNVSRYIQFCQGV